MKRPVFAALCATLTVLAFSLTTVFAQTFPIKKRKKNIPGQRAIVYDERLSALRTQPDVKAQLVSRLHREREVGIIGAARSTNGGPLFYPVAVSRNVRGWIIAEALARPQRGQDATRMINLLDETKDEFSRARLARLCADQFSSLPVAPQALLQLGQAAEQASSRLSREAKRRVGETEEPFDKNLSERDYLLNYVGLDRYNKLGITFEYDATSERLMYDGGAYQEILKKYPRSPEANEARARLERLKQQPSPSSSRKAGTS
ncbi:MAG TPA: hypothetical protein VFZ34_28615 [Blastocatellia bacterium]|nr:hypothetical protein [Blastocatellia bacterium]